MMKEVRFLAFIITLLSSFQMNCEPTLWDFFYRFWAESRMIMAAGSGNIPDLKYYTSDRRCDVNSELISGAGLTALTAAVNSGEIKAVQYLLKNTNAYLGHFEGKPLLSYAVRWKKFEIAFLMLLWRKEQAGQQRDEALKLTKKENDHFTNLAFEPMLSDFEKFVNDSQSLLPEYLKEDVKQYKTTIPATYERIRIAGGLKWTETIRNYQFQ